MRHLEVGVGRDQELEMESDEAGVLEEPEMRSDNQGETNDGEDKGQEEGRELLWGPVCLGGSDAVSSYAEKFVVKGGKNLGEDYV